jgi:putative endonuclease
MARRSANDAGASGEAFVMGRLIRAGYEILDRNWRVRGGELDIVALDDKVLVFVEVKVRTGERINTAEEALDERKLARLMSAAETYIDAHAEHHDRIWRVDLVAVTLSPSGAVRRYTHVENVTME